MTTLKRQLVALAAAAACASASAAHATIEFNVAGLAGTGVTANVKFTYTSTSATVGSLKFVIENTTDYSSSATVGSRISGFGFNIPTIAGTAFTTIADLADGDSVVQLGPPPSQVTPENQASSFNELGWYGLWETDDIKTPNKAGFFDFGILNNNNRGQFITDGVGSGPRIENYLDTNDFTTFTLNVDGTGLNTGDAAIEQAFMNALSVSKPGSEGSYNFGVRFQGIPAQPGSDFAVVPTPSAAALAALGLGIVGWVNRRRVV